ncbi:MAG: SBBP repeat-containing protein, partial [candidate division WOR-3 bacterium]
NAGYFDAFILKFDSLGALLWATYYGGSDGENGSSIKTDINGNVFITGTTSSTNFPVYNPGGGSYFDNALNGNSDAFILRFNNLGIRQWATYFGGGNEDIGSSIKTDIYSRLFILGYTNSYGFPTYNPGNNAYYQGNLAGSYDVFISKFDSASVYIPERANSYYYKDRILLKNLNLRGKVLINIYAIDGRLVYSRFYESSNLIEISIKHLRSGIYIIKAYNNNKEILSYKFIKK